MSTTYIICTQHLRCSRPSAGAKPRAGHGGQDLVRKDRPLPVCTYNICGELAYIKALRPRMRAV